MLFSYIFRWADKFPQGSVTAYGVNTWTPCATNQHLYIRNQRRKKTGKRDISECDNKLESLPPVSSLNSTDNEESLPAESSLNNTGNEGSLPPVSSLNSTDNEESLPAESSLNNTGNEGSLPPVSSLNSTADKKCLFLHGTSWTKANLILKSGVKIEERPTDLASDGAFYLNDSSSDCYDWLYTNNSTYRGEHAMLIYNVNPWTLSKNGEETTYEEWKKIIQKRNSSKSTRDWSLTYQNSRPADHRKQGKNPKARHRSDDTVAKQLVIRSQTMCDKMASHCIGCIFYEKIDNYPSIFAVQQPLDQKNPDNTNETGTPLNENMTSTNRSRYGSIERKKKRKKNKDRSEARDSKRFRDE